MADQLFQVLKENNIFDKFQSAFWHKHRKQTALLRVTNDSRGEHSISVNVDVSEELDTTDHKILIDWLHVCVGISGVAPDWFI